MYEKKLIDEVKKGLDTLVNQIEEIETLFKMNKMITRTLRLDGIAAAHSCL